MIKVIWQYRNFVIACIKNEQRAKFSRSFLGGAWAVLQPLAQAAIFAFVLTEGLGARLPNIDNKYAFVVYLLSGMAAWSLFAEIVNRSITIFVDNAPALKKIAFPRLCLPVIVLGNALFSHALLLAASLVIFAFVGFYPSPAIISILLAIVLIAAMGFGIGLIAGIFNVFSRDVSQAFVIIMQIWFWLTPIVYPRDALPANFRWIIDYNPMAQVVQIYQNAFLHGKIPELYPLLLPALLAFLLLDAALILFRRASPDMVDAL